MRRAARQAQILEFLSDYIDREGYPPTLREIQAAIGLRAISYVLRILEGMQDDGLIHRTTGTARAIRILEKGREMSGAKTENGR